MNDELREKIREGQDALQSIQAVMPSGGLRHPELVAEEMNELISEEYEPYFLGNAALHLASVCQRCGRCCREEPTVAVSFQDCRRIAKQRGMSLKRFLKEYTLPHSLQGEAVGNARMIRKAKNGPCPFYDSRLPGCSIQPVKPQVCAAALYLSKMNLLLCEENRIFSTFSNCPADVELRAGIKDFVIKLRDEPEAEKMLRELLQSSPKMDLFRLLLRLKGLEIYFGKDTALPFALKLGLKRLPEDGELRTLAFLYAADLLETEITGPDSPRLPV